MNDKRFNNQNTFKYKSLDLVDKIQVKDYIIDESDNNS